MLKYWQLALEKIEWRHIARLLGGMWLMIGTFLLGLCFVDVGELRDFSWLDGIIAGAFVGLALGLIFEEKHLVASRWSLLCGGLWVLLMAGHLGVVGWMVPDALGLLYRFWLGGIYGVVVGGFLGLLRGIVSNVSGQRLKRVVMTNCGIWMGAIAWGWVVGGWLRSESQLFVGEVVGLMVCWGLIGIGYSLEKILEEECWRRKP